MGAKVVASVNADDGVELRVRDRQAVGFGAQGNDLARRTGSQQALPVVFWRHPPVCRDHPDVEFACQENRSERLAAAKVEDKVARGGSPTVAEGSTSHNGLGSIWFSSTTRRHSGSSGGTRGETAGAATRLRPLSQLGTHAPGLPALCLYGGEGPVAMAQKNLVAAYDGSLCFRQGR